MPIQTDPNKKDILVIGAGITGLTSAYRLHSNFNVTLLEASARTGGKLYSIDFRGKRVDVGPDSFLTRNASAAQLASELNLSEHLVAPVRQGASLYSRKQLRKLPIDLALGIPTNISSVLASRIVSPISALRSAADFFWLKRLPDFTSLLDMANQTIPPFTSTQHLDPSIGQLLNKRLGKETVERLIAPLIAGINAGDINCLSFAATTPELARTVSRQRSVIFALRNYKKQSAHSTSAPGLAPFLGLDTSLAALPETLTQNLLDLGVNIRTETKATEVKINPHDKRQWLVTIRHKNMLEEKVSFDGIILALPAFAAAPLLSKCLPDLAALCEKIPFSSVATLLAAWNTEELPTIYGTGFLVARKPKKLITGVTSLSSKWAHLSNTDEVWLKISAGHYSDTRAVTLDDKELTSAMIQDIKSILGITKDPLDMMLFRWENAFPQYNTGHIERLRKIDSMLAAIPTLALAGASYHGIGIPACISDGTAAANKLSNALQ